jgi:hypothetical protein
MEKSTSETATPETKPAQFERPLIEEVSLGCEISAYAPDDDDRPLF